MRATIDRTLLSKALQLAGKAVNPSPPVPLLANILIHSENGKLRVSGTNLEIGVSCEFPSTGELFDVCVPSKTFVSLVDAIYSDELNIVVNEADQSITVETESSRTNVKCMSSEDFPPIPRVSKPNFIMPVQVFKEMVNRVAFSAKRSDSQSALSGVLLALECDEPENGKKGKKLYKFVMFATDGFHISYEHTTELVGSKPTETRAIVRADILELVSRLLPNEGHLMVEIGESKAMFQCEDIDIVTQLMGVDFPDYHLVAAVVPNENTTKTSVVVNTLELLRAAKQLKVFATNTSKTRLDIEGVMLKYSIETQNQGSSVVEIIAMCKGIPVSIGINVHFLLSFLEVCKTPQVVIQIISEKSPIRFDMKDYNSYFHVIMPVAL